MNFDTENMVLPVGSFRVTLTTVKNIDELFDNLISKGVEHEDVKDERIPYWAELWASAIAMAQYMVENDMVKAGVQVTEIGCGLGLPSIVAGLMGGNVVMTDYLDDALDFARLNWQQNLPDKNARFERLDWRQPTPSVSADLVLASDVAYEARAFEPLIQAFQILLNPGGTLLISEPNRLVSKNFFLQILYHLFPDNTEGYGLKHTIKHIELKKHVHTVNIYALAPIG